MKKYNNTEPDFLLRKAEPGNEGRWDFDVAVEYVLYLLTENDVHDKFFKL